MTGEPPVLKGYTITPHGNGWIAQHDRIQDRRFFGRDQAELDAARASAMARDIAAIRERMAATDPSGYPRAGRTDCP